MVICSYDLYSKGYSFITARSLYWRSYGWLKTSCILYTHVSFQRPSYQGGKGYYEKRD